MLAHAGDDKSLWGPIFEKAFAKYHGNYLHIAGGWPTVGARTVAGGPGETYSHSEFSADDLWTMLKKHDGLDDILQAGTPGTSDRNTNEYGLVNSHAYTVIGVKELSSGDRLVQLRNPWGNDSFNGDWSDKSNKWTAALRQEAGATDDQGDGFIWMSIEDYQKQASQTFINIDTEGKFSDYFLKLDDDGTGSTPGSYRWCGSSCTRHKLTIKSDVDQTIWVAAHTWDRRGIPSACRKDMKPHSIEAEWMSYVMNFRYGAADLDTYEIKANQETVITTEWNWAELEDISKDWSVVVWGDKGNVSIKHNDGL